MVQKLQNSTSLKILKFEFDRNFSNFNTVQNMNA